ncbi:YfgM family protein [Flavihumibacter profundi]|jgi:tetratricopeptide (TPR) repeat protein|uniref:YfgM family protein n=1 Tax=Flavihumibacter profundi TaxID=2716883 RepID=UPI001CC5CA52|nr:tetratricopeptide repeat protein [Flavihumibacter profundi]MBZ5856164.1 tetratricopeptide repeat protein [Flavihumibacter profundi]
MADHKHIPVETIPEVEIVDKVTGFWQQNSKNILIGVAAIVIIAGGVAGYKYFISGPKTEKANEAIFRAENYFRMDSLQLALNGDATNPGFIKIIDRYSGTPAANLSKFYAGASYLRLGDYAKAEKYLKDFSTGAPQINARAKSLLADTYSEQGKKEEAAKLYREAAGLFDKDEFNSSEYLFRAGYLYESLGKNAEAIEAYKTIKEKYPRTERGFEVDKYLARLGETE